MATHQLFCDRNAPFRISILLAGLIVFSTSAFAQPFDSTFQGQLQWRSIGPYRGGLVRAISGVPGQPNLFYMAPVDGGIWKSDDFGRTWQPIFDREPTGSIGAIAVASSNPDIIYAGSGESTRRGNLSTGDGIYKTVDAGNTWTHLGLRDGQQIAKIALDPQDPGRLFVAVMGHPYGSNEERGIFRSTDGGQTFQKVLYKDEDTGGSDVAIDPSQPNTVYASLWGGISRLDSNGQKGCLFKSTDGGTTWKKLGRGLPGGGDSLIQVNIAIGASNPQQIYITTCATGGVIGIYCSRDAGETWSHCTDDPRPAMRIGGGGELPGIAVDPKHANVVYAASIVLWKSSDSGKTWTGIRGAPGGDDYQNIWINPQNPDILLVGSDQGAIVSVNGGRTWSSWYNQPTGQIYHVSSDNEFPYHVYGGQQDCGSVGIASRGNDGEITSREWHPAGLWESEYVVPDPINTNIIYSDKTYEGIKLLKYDKRTGQAQDVAPPPDTSHKYRFREAPIVFSPVDHKTLYFGANVLFKTVDGGAHWTIISPDLTRKSYHSTSPSLAWMNKLPPVGSINAIAPSPLDVLSIWVGTNDGLIQVTHDGGNTWTDVTPPSVSSLNRVSLMDAAHFDLNSAYAAVNCSRLDDRHPHIYRTHDGGKTWKEIVNGLPDDPVNVVREDPLKRGLLFAGSERAVYVSFDDGDHWQPLRLNMPATSNRDLTINGNDLVTATHGRGLWIMDDIEPLRQLTGGLIAQDAFLYKPATVYRVRWNVNADTPVPPDEPAGQNPPDGAVIDYYLKSDVMGEVRLEISDATGRVVRRYSSEDTLYKIAPQNIPLYWIRPQVLLSAKAGFHRFTWDLHYPPLNIPPDYPNAMAAVYNNTPPIPTAPWVVPGVYTIKLSVDGEDYVQKLTVKMDPRSLTSSAELQQQFDLSMQCYEGRRQVLEAGKGFINHSDKQKEFDELNRRLSDLFDRLQSSDKPPTPQMVAQVGDATRLIKQKMANWKDSGTK
jgi:photosystem II stability/assembly factor-like uncharacterized protein